MKFSNVIREAKKITNKMVIAKLKEKGVAPEDCTLAAVDSAYHDVADDIGKEFPTYSGRRSKVSTLPERRLEKIADEYYQSR